MTITDNCTACRACQYTCTHGAISLFEDNESFLSAFIDPSKCVNCGLCKLICPQENTLTVDRIIEPMAWAAKHHNKEIVKKSTSGGVFTALSENIIRDGGIVFGVVLRDNHAITVRVNTIEDLKYVRSSKYVASDTLDTYVEVKQLLKAGKKVLFSGLPCQIGGLRAFLRKEYENLFLVDVICHGTPSIKLYEVYISYLKEKYGQDVRDYKFRDKSKYGWGCYWSFKYGKDKKRSGGLHDDPYVSAFIDGYAKRNSCYSCRYVGIENRPGDITLGDYWGVDKYHPNIASNEGVSAVIANTIKGLNFINGVLPSCFYEKTEIAWIEECNPSLYKTEKRPLRRDNIYLGIYSKTPFEYINENLRISKMGFLKTKIRLLLPYKTRVFIKKIQRKLYSYFLAI